MPILLWPERKSGRKGNDLQQFEAKILPWVDIGLVSTYIPKDKIQPTLERYITVF